MAAAVARADSRLEAEEDPASEGALVIRRERLPAFARAWDDALEEAQPLLRSRLMEARCKGGPALEPGAWDPVPDPADFDVEEAMWPLKRRPAARGAVSRDEA